MEMGEHSPIHGVSGEVPAPLCERPISHLCVWLEYGVNVEHVGRVLRSLHPLCE